MTNTADNRELFSRSGQRGLEQPDAFLSPSTSSKPSGRRVTEGNLASRIDVFQNSSAAGSEGDPVFTTPIASEKEKVSMIPRNTPNGAPCTTGKIDSIDQDPVKSLLSVKPPLASRSRSDDDSTTTSGKMKVNPVPSFASAGHSGFGRPDDFVGSPSEQKRRSWRPKAVTDSKGNPSFTTPTATEKRKVAVIRNVPNSAPCTTGEIDGIAQAPVASLLNLRPPLSRSRHSDDDSSTSSGKMKASLIASFTSAGHSGFGRPDDFVGSPSGERRRSWRPKAVTDIEGNPSFATPTANGKGRVSVIRNIPNGAPCTIGESDSIDQDPVTSLSSVKPPLASGSRHSDDDSNTSNGNKKVSPVSSFASAGPSDFGRPEDSVGSPSGPKRSYWRPVTASTEDGNVYSTPTKGPKEKHSVKTEGFPEKSPLRTTSPGKLGPENPVSGTGSPRRTTSEAMLIAVKIVVPEQASRRASAPVDLEGLHSPMTRTRWSRNIDPSKLPPAFQTTHRGSSGTSKPSTVGRHIDPSQLERVVARKKSTMSPSKLRRKWPPGVRSNSGLFILSRTRASGVVPEDSVKQRRSTFEQNHDDKTGLALQIVPRPSREEHPGIVSPGSHVSEITYAFDALSSVGMSNLEDRADRWGQAGSQAPLRPHGRYETSMKIRWGGPTFYTIEGRPLLLYYEDPFIDEDGNELPFAPLLEDRFGSSVDDSSPMRPSRALYDDWSDDESYYSSGEEEEGATTRKKDKHKVRGQKRPDVWVTPMDSETTAPTDGKWRVKRVWNVAAVDEREMEHSVDDNELMNKVKVLLGVPSETARNGEGMLSRYDSSASQWRAKKVYDVDGEIQVSGTTQKLDENGILDAFNDVSKEQLETAISELPTMGEEDSADVDATPSQESAISAKESLSKQESSDLNVTEHTLAATIGESHVVGNEADNAGSGKDAVSLAESSCSAEGERSYEMDVIHEQAVQELVGPIVAPRSTPTKEKKKKRQEKRGQQSLFDLLSPPSVSTFHWKEDLNDK